jgi:Taurine catabolism dioxygenase TauD, TfdA family
VASAATVWNVFLSERPDLLAPLIGGFHFYRPTADRGASPPLTPVKLPVFAADMDGQLHCSFIPELIRSGARHDGGNLSPLAAEALDFFEAVTNREGIFLDMEFRPGDMQFLNDRTTIHGRTDYQDWPEPELRRHLFRLWLMCPHWPRPSVRLNVFDEADRAGGGIPKAA